jgi:hypothetical protein
MATFLPMGKLLLVLHDITKIGTNSLAVNGTAIFTKAKVKALSIWPDYVFGENFQLPTLYELENYLKINEHLPDIPNSDDVERNGIDLGEGQTTLVKKIEELTLYIIRNKQKIR